MALAKVGLDRECRPAAIATLVAVMALRPDKVVRLRHAPLPEQRRCLNDCDVNFAVDELHEGGGSDLLGAFMRPEPAEAAFEAIARKAPGRLILVHHGRVIRKHPDPE
jgi:hypothetical protein